MPLSSLIFEYETKVPKTWFQIMPHLMSLFFQHCPVCIKRCWMMPCHDHRVLNSLFSSHQKMFITRSLRHPRGGPFASECSIFAPKTRVINSALLMYLAGVAEPRAHHGLTYALITSPQGWHLCVKVLNFCPQNSGHYFCAPSVPSRGGGT